MPHPQKTERRDLLGFAPSAKGRTIFGYAAKFATRSRPLSDGRGGTFIETIAKGAFDGCDMSDIRAYFNHDKNAVLARRKGNRGTLRLTVDSVGLRYEFEAPETQLGNDTLELIRRGDLDESSFAFTLAPGGDSWKTEAGTRLRTITKIATLHDVSICAEGAYPDTPVASRARATKATTPAKFAAGMTRGEALTRHCKAILARVEKNRPRI